MTMKQLILLLLFATCHFTSHRAARGQEKANSEETEIINNYLSKSTAEERLSFLKANRKRFKPEIIAIINNTAQFQLEQGQTKVAQALHLLALEAATFLGDKNLIGATHTYLGMLLHGEGEISPALEEYQKALKEYRAAKISVEEIMVLNKIGNLYLREEEFEKAIEPLTEALALAEKSNNKQDQVRVAVNLSIAQMSLLRFEDANRTLSKALQVATSAKNPQWQAQVEAELANIKQLQGK